VPLIVADPAEREPGRRVGQQVRLLDVLPTIAARLAAPHALQIEGRDLGPLLRGGQDEPRLAFGGDTRVGPPREFVRTAVHKYIERTDVEPQAGLLPEAPARQLFDLSADPGEQRDLAAERPDLADAFARLLAERRGGDPHASSTPLLAELPEPLQERLRALGYAD
jgi:arylsulfatase A-like enzyme